MEEKINEQLVLISGESASGKSASLRQIPNQERWMYLNCESGKRLPFRNDFKTFKITDPYQVYEGFDHATANPDKWDGIIVDTVTFLMDMYESTYIIGSANSQKAWGDYAQFYKNLMQDKVVNFGKPVLILGHTRSELNEAKHQMETAVPVKGSLKNNGVEAYFSTVVSTKKVPILELEKYGSKLLTITEEERDLGFKHVFQTRLTKQTVGERIRSPMGMFSKEETYIDNDAWALLGHLHQYYRG
ncbi:AAA family ATPase [Brucella anthropi]|uniref:AAA family ATPase n=1 Tax=Brucella anthropi TaxID=529 RepID=UPI000F66361B|nr:AAA family ATPase [Brucella anthropi]RRY03837.1 hypothetical protein EGJ58_22305 [Brucella anthropi]